ncbi:bifunctional demethylmenaquinone methyltransferase/2-methoxy-6-polyprenyl-1,4-benzoquinol methylase [Helicobacter monodelphidis]|nr:bifunctional demethylmenaquinone methyltransferase/2-methoxy-6-polyprenyl-1,4-benzoquinol methylase [Helicobacter sp. 15-1451]
MFDSISERYDIANRVLSMGIDISWRKKGCQISLKEVQKTDVDIVDVACGTGDMIIHWREVATKLGVNIASICGIDPSAGMLEVARKKLQDTHFIQAEAIKIPLESESVDIISIAYGLRNVVDRDNAFKEFYRILRKGGILVILEFTKNENNGFLEQIAGFYTRKILPKIGGLISKNMAAYQYLPNSIEEFLTLSLLEQELRQNKLEPIYSKSYSANISTLCISKK